MAPNRTEPRSPECASPVWLDSVNSTGDFSRGWGYGACHTHAGTRPSAWWHSICTLSASRKQADPQSSLASQTSWISDPKFDEKSCLKKHVESNWRKQGQPLHTCLHADIHEHACTQNTNLHIGTIVPNTMHKSRGMVLMIHCFALKPMWFFPFLLWIYFLSSFPLYISLERMADHLNLVVQSGLPRTGGGNDRLVIPWKLITGHSKSKSFFWEGDVRWGQGVHQRAGEWVLSKWSNEAH